MTSVKYVKLVNRRCGTVLGSRFGVADRWWLRLRGLLGRPAPAEGEGLLITPCRALHMYGMGFALDVAFLNRAWAVLALYPGLAPWTRTGWHRAAIYALELPVGVLGRSGTVEGDTIVCLSEESA